ncbi:MAG: RluA family pseudouridine synthase [Pyrinomonadaceae bacterium]|nr:RluA family pseudouridine synthase [Pyrinomonadaceae bacterium]
MPTSEQITRLTFEVEPECHKQKLGAYLNDHLPQLSKMYIRELVREGHIEVNGAHENSGYRARPRDFIEVTYDPTRGTSMRPEQIPLDIVFEDAHLIVVNKPAGMLVHPSHREKTGTLLNALTYHLNHSPLGAMPLDVRKSSAFPADLTQECGYAAAPRHSLKSVGEADGEAELLRTSSGEAAKMIRPGLVHRLDKNTSGLIVVAKTPAAHRNLSRAFMRKQVKKLYIALVEGIIVQNEGTITAPIGRHADQKQWSVHAQGKPSESRYRVLERRTDTTLVELEPITGRTNQLRIHCQLIGHPILGDQQRSTREFPRLCLHAQHLAFPHPANNEPLQFQTPTPPEFS